MRKNKEQKRKKEGKKGEKSRVGERNCKGSLPCSFELSLSTWLLFFVLVLIDLAGVKIRDGKDLLFAIGVLKTKEEAEEEVAEEEVSSLDRRKLDLFRQRKQDAVKLNEWGEKCIR